MVRMCRLAPTMATLILAPWEFWLSCKNSDCGGNTDLCLSQEGVCGAEGGRWVTRRLQGSDPLNLGPNSISPASLVHHYQTLSPRQSRIVISCKCLTKKKKKEQDAHFLSSLCIHNGRLIVFYNWALYTCTILRECTLVSGGTDLTLMSCCYGDGARAMAWRHGLPVWQRSNFLGWYKLLHFSFYRFSCYLVGRGQTELFHVGHLLKWMQTTVRL